MTLSAKDLVRDLSLVAPGLDAGVLPENTELHPGPKAWFQHQAAMPDGLPVYTAPEVPGYTHGVHNGLLRWLEVRGWEVVPFHGIHARFMEWVGLRPAMPLTGRVHLLMPHDTANAGDPYGMVEALRRLVPRGRTTPELLLARVKRNKQRLNRALKRGELPESTRKVMRAAAELNPDLFGEWSNL